MLCTKCDIFFGCITIAKFWIHGTIKWAGEKLARGVECCVDGRSEAVWKCPLVGCFRGCALWVAYIGAWAMITLHEFDEILGGVGGWRVDCELGV